MSGRKSFESGNASIVSLWVVLPLFVSALACSDTSSSRNEPPQRELVTRVYTAIPSTLAEAEQLVIFGATADMIPAEGWKYDWASLNDCFESVAVLVEKTKLRVNFTTIGVCVWDQYVSAPRLVHLLARLFDAEGRQLVELKSPEIFCRQIGCRNRLSAEAWWERLEGDPEVIELREDLPAELRYPMDPQVLKRAVHAEVGFLVEDA
jgi:hypothetical protein